MFGYKQPEQSDFEYDKNGYDVDAFPVLLSEQTVVDEAKFALSLTKPDHISYYERAGSRGWRVCRIENWLPPSLANKDTDQAQRRAFYKHYIGNNKELEKVTQGFLPLSATLFYYDAKGRVVRVSAGDFGKPDERELDLTCREYDLSNRLLLSVHPINSQTCPNGVPDVRDVWTEYKYGGTVEPSEILLNKTHTGKHDGTWREHWAPFVGKTGTETIRGTADVDSKDGVSLISGLNLGALDDNSANTVLDAFGKRNSSTYVFVRPPVSASILEKPGLLYNYDRRRQTLIDRSTKMFEFFKAGEHISRHRYYLNDGLVVRHEQLAANGKVKRVITVNGYTQPRSGKTPAVNDGLLDRKQRFMHQVYHRVYEVDATSRPVLVAMSWARSKSFGNRASRPMEPEELVFGTPDGKQRWKNQAEFERRFETSGRAAQVFPDAKPAFAPVQPEN